MSSVNNTRVRFREPPKERINCIPLLGEGDVRRENISCFESPKPPETAQNKMHHIKAIEGNVIKHHNVNWTIGLKIDISADRSDEYHKSITIESLVGDDKVSALVDSGASISAISGELLKKFPHWRKYPIMKPPHCRLSSVNNEELDIAGEVRIPFSMKDVNFTHNFLVVEKMTSQMILGLDWLHKHKCNIDICQKMITLSVPEPEMETIQALAELPQIISTDEIINTHSGTSFDTKIILPASQRDITVIVPPSMKEGQYWIKIHPKLIKAHQGLEVKTTDYIHECQNAISVVMRNSTSEPIELYAGCTLIELEMKHTSTEDDEEEAKIRKKLLTATICSELSIDETIAHVICEITNNINLSEEEKKMATKLITDKQEIFVTDPNDLKCCNVYKVEIVLTDDKPVHIKNYRFSFKDHTKIMNHVTKLLAAGTIVDSCSPYNYPCLLVPKGHSGDTRMVINYKELNKKCAGTITPSLGLMISSANCMEPHGSVHCTVHFSN
jgi:hypothetical protein